MPMLINPRHERFAQGLATGKSAAGAYRAAGYNDNYGNASTLKGNQKVQDRVAELQNRAAAGVVLKREWVIERLIENADRAMQIQPILDGKGQPTGEYRYDGSVANRALELLGKEIGMFVDRQVNDQIVRVISAEPMTSDEWERHYSDQVDLGSTSRPPEIAH